MGDSDSSTILELRDHYLDTVAKIKGEIYTIQFKGEIYTKQLKVRFMQQRVKVRFTQ